MKMPPQHPLYDKYRTRPDVETTTDGSLLFWEPVPVPDPLHEYRDGYLGQCQILAITGRPAQCGLWANFALGRLSLCHIHARRVKDELYEEAWKLAGEFRDEALSAAERIASAHIAKKKKAREKRLPPPNSRVYFVQRADGLIKIGKSYRLGDRLSSLTTATGPLTLLCDIPGYTEEERAIHERFATARVHGEWFSPTPELMAFIQGSAK